MHKRNPYRYIYLLKFTNMYGSMDKIMRESKYICPSRRAHITLFTD